jgi:hypothetical protein
VLDLPASWTDNFALVHQRFLWVALTLPEWKIALENLFRVTAPGGYIQLGEVGEVTSGLATARFTNIMCELFKSRGIERYLPDLLPGF